MEREKLDNLIEEVMEDLKNKSEMITAAAETPDIVTRTALQEVKNKATAILEKAGNAIGNAREGAYDPKQIVEGLKVAIDRSQTLFEQTMMQINKIKGVTAEGSQGSDLFPLLPSEEETVQEETPAKIEEISEENEAEESPDEVSDTAHEILESWIAPESEGK